MSAALAAPPTSPTSPTSPTVAADLVLARMAVPSKNPPAPSVVRRDVGKLLHGRDLTAVELAAVRESLIAERALAPATRRSVRLTDAGRSRALTFLGIAEFPPRTTWRSIVAQYLFPRATGLSPEAAARLSTGDRVAAFLVKRTYGLPGGTGESLQQAMEALTCQKLGFSNETSLDGLMRTVVSRVIGHGDPLTKKDLATQLPRIVAGTPNHKPDTLRAAVIRGWLSGPAEPEPSAEFDLTAFAATVNALARTSPPDDRFHDKTVFIAAVWRASQREHGFPRLTLPEFKARLVEANRDGLLKLSRADQDMDPARVVESETSDRNATFHFVLIEGDSA